MGVESWNDNEIRQTACRSHVLSLLRAGSHSISVSESFLNVQLYRGLSTYSCSLCCRRLCSQRWVGMQHTPSAQCPLGISCMHSGCPDGWASAALYGFLACEG